MSDRDLFGEPMTQAKVAAYFGDFPWLEKYAKKPEVVSIQVDRVDTDLLTARRDKITEEVTWTETGYCDGPYTKTHRHNVSRCESIFILDEQGETLLRVGAREAVVEPARVIPGWSGWWLIPGWQETRVPEKREWQFFPETIEEGIQRLGGIEEKKNKGSFVLSVLWTENHGTRVVIHKSPKGHDLVSWIKIELERERRLLREKIAEIDAVAPKAP